MFLWNCSLQTSVVEAFIIYKVGFNTDAHQKLYKRKDN